MRVISLIHRDCTFLLLFVTGISTTALPSCEVVAGETDLRQHVMQEFPRALTDLVKQATRALNEKPASVMDKSGAAPSGDKHDFYSLSPYHWPNPKTPDGIPYVFRDGELNPEVTSEKNDRVRYFAMGTAVTRVAVAYRLTGNESFARHAALLLRTWFLDPATRMNPNLQYAQVIPGSDEPSRSGIIRGTLVLEMVDAANLLDASPEWTEADRAGWMEWQREYLKWLVESELGKSEAKAFNNHGTWYDAQVATLAMECGDMKTAREVLSSVPERRIAPQIGRDGRQAFELVRTKSWDYSLFNLEAYCRLARLGERMDIGLWNWQSEKCGGIRGAIDYLIPFATGEEAWKEKQIRDFEPEQLYAILIQAARAYDDPRYVQAAKMIPGFDPSQSAKALRGVVALNDAGP